MVGFVIRLDSGLFATVGFRVSLITLDTFFITFADRFDVLVAVFARWWSGGSTSFGRARGSGGGCVAARSRGVGSGFRGGFRDRGRRSVFCTFLCANLTTTECFRISLPAFSAFFVTFTDGFNIFIAVFAGGGLRCVVRGARRALGDRTRVASGRASLGRVRFEGRNGE